MLAPMMSLKTRSSRTYGRVIVVLFTHLSVPDTLNLANVRNGNVVLASIHSNSCTSKGWRLSVKSHPFVDGTHPPPSLDKSRDGYFIPTAIHEHYGVEFRKQAADYQGIKPPGAWTLPILSKIICASYSPRAPVCT